MQTYHVTITGLTPLLMHWDNIQWADDMEAWKNDPGNKKNSRAGDDRTPAWRWIGSVYNDGANVVIPSDNLARAMMEGGAMVLVPGGRSGKTFKAQSQSGIRTLEESWALTVNGNAIDYADIDALRQVSDFKEHIAAARRLGFDLFVKRAKVGASKHIRVRPRFDQWAASGEVAVLDEQITHGVLSDILSYAGKYKGLGDWRPGGRTPGSYGMFTAEVSQ